VTFAMSGQEDASVDSFRGYYKALWNCDLVVDFIEPKSLNNNRYRVDHRALAFDRQEGNVRATPPVCRGGRTLIIETGFGTYDEHMIFNPAVPPFGLADVFGYREGEVLFMENSGPSVPKMEGLPASERIICRRAPGLLGTRSRSSQGPHFLDTADHGVRDCDCDV